MENNQNQVEQKKTEQFSEIGLAENFNILLKLVPISIGFIYICGYIIRLSYFRSINVNCIGFFKAECLETGFTFLVLSLCVFSVVAFPFYILKLRKDGYHLIPPYLTNRGLFISGIAFSIAVVTAILVALFFRPQDIYEIHVDFGRMIMGTLGFILILLISTKVIGWYIQVGKDGGSTPIPVKYFILFADIIRLLFLVFIAWQALRIFFDKKISPLYIFIDEYCLPYILFLGLFIFLAYLITKAYFISQKSLLGLSIRSSFIIITLYLMLVSFTFGPFLHIPTNRGGGRQYSTVNIFFKNEKDASRYPFVSSVNSIQTKDVILLEENDCWIYVAPIPTAFEKLPPRKAFKILRNDKTYCIDKRSIASIDFKKLP